MAVHPNQALFGGEKPFPVIPACEHFAGSEKLILKALSLQDPATPNGVGPVFDITCDCEDGAASGQEQAHAEMIVRVLNSEANKYKMAGARIHDYTHPHWKKDIDILVGGAGDVLSYITIPKCTDIAQAREMITYIQQVAKQHSIGREIPVHILIETHGALRQVHQIAQLPWLQVLDFGLMDFVSAHHGAIPAAAMPPVAGTRQDRSRLCRAGQWRGACAQRDARPEKCRSHLQRCVSRAQRIRLYAYVEYLSDADSGHCRCHET